MIKNIYKSVITIPKGCNLNYLGNESNFAKETKIFRLKGKSRAIISVANLIKKSRKDGELKS